MPTIVEVQAATVLPPVQTAIAAIQLNTTPQVIDLTSMPTCPAVNSDPGNQNPVGHYVRITMRGGDGYYAMGSNATTLAAISPNSYTAVAANGKLTLTNNEASIVPAGTYVDLLVPNGGGSPQAQNPSGGRSPCRYVSLVAASGTPVAEIHQSST